MSRKIKNGLVVPTEREMDMYRMWGEGNTLQYVGEHFNVSREYIRQILNSRFGATGTGNIRKHAKSMLEQYVKTREKVDASREHRENEIARWFGCHDELVTYINDGVPFSWSEDKRKKSKVGAYVDQQRFAKQRGIPWKMTFPEWWSVWRESGKYAERGRTRGKYVMSRLGDIGPYELGNVKICTVRENFDEGLVTCPMAERAKRRRKNADAKAGIQQLEPSA